MTDSWEDKKKSKKGIGFIIFLCIAIVFIGFLIFNNFDFFKQKRETESIKVEDSDKAEKEVEASEDVKPEKGKEEENEKTVQEEPPETASPEEDKESELEPSEESVLSIDLPTIKCALADKRGLFVQVTLKVHFKGKKLEREILFKRDNIKVIVKKVLLKKHLSEVVVEKLRVELKKEINVLLEQGKIEDIEFLDFRPIENI